MRGPDKQSIVCRTADGLVEKCESFTPLKEKYKLASVPFLRGVIALAVSMSSGMKALAYSAELIPMDEEEEPSKFEVWLEDKLGNKKMEKLTIAFSMVLGLFLAILLFTMAPTFLAGLFPFVKANLMLRSAVEGVFKLIIFFAYLWLITNIKDVRRLFAYHGAEHKTIFCYEKSLPLTAENVKKQSRFHPRCGTSFLLVAVILGIIIGFFIRADNVFIRVLLRIALLPLLVGIAFELNKWVGKHDDNKLAAVLAAPGKWVQRLTTKEPDEEMIECAIRALELVIPEEKGADSW